MKKFLFVILLINAFWCFSQDTDEPVTIRFDLPAADQGLLTSDNTRDFVVKGSQFLNEEHQIGTVINGKTRTEALIRYNAYNDTFQLIDENGKKATILKSPKIRIELDGKTYQLVSYEETVRDKALYYVPENVNGNNNKKQGYFCSLTDGETILYSKTTKKIPKLKLPENGYQVFTPSSFVTVNHYYVKRKHRPAVRIELSKKEVLFALNNKYNEVRAYIKRNKLKVKTVEEVLQVISFYDTLN